jgi:hypothetical protein
MEAGVTNMSSAVLKDESQARIGSRLVRELFDDEDPCGKEGGWSHWHVLRGKVGSLGMWFDPETVAEVSKIVPKKKGVYEYGVSFHDSLDQIIVLYAGKGGGSRSHAKSPELKVEGDEESETTETDTPGKAKADMATLHQRICNGYLSNGSDSGREFIALLSLGLCVRFRWMETDNPVAAEKTMLAKYDYAFCSAKNNGCRELDTLLMPLEKRENAKFPLTCAPLIQVARCRAHKVVADMSFEKRSLVMCLGSASVEQRIALGAVASFVGLNGELLPHIVTLPSQYPLSKKEYNEKLKATKQEAEERWMRQMSNTLTSEDRSPQRGSKKTTQQRLNFGDKSL